MKRDYLSSFVLVGGTSLALQIGHRKSIDLDLFTVQDFNSENLVSNLLQDYRLVVSSQMPQTLIGNINGIKVDFIRFKFPFLYPIIELNGIRMLSMQDIAPMKLDAITGRGSKKDFFDLYFLLQHISLENMLNLYKEKYAHQTLFHVVRSLVYFADAEQQPDPMVLDKKVTWTKVKKTIVKEIQAII
ncbi:MAG: nucleotidyl transferase AbiEii/AbiGii toxin family protein [Cytophagales bacterium]|nr:nucleotidyl transferase AbiEii/AbiGii toxin family protein [Cytophagales bacterium]